MLRQIIIMLFFCSTAWAAPISYEIIGRAYNDGWWYQAGSAYVGPGNRGGTALGFSLAQNVHVGFIAGLFNGVAPYPGQATRMYVELYQGSILYRDTDIKIPNGAVAPIWADSFEVKFEYSDWNNVLANHTIDKQLDAGEYWISYRGGDSLSGISHRGMEIDGEVMAGVHAPEPATMLLMGGGLLAMLRRRKK